MTDDSNNTAPSGPSPLASSPPLADALATIRRISDLAELKCYTFPRYVDVVQDIRKECAEFLENAKGDSQSPDQKS